MRRIIWIGILLGAACSVLFAGLATTGQVAVAQVEPLPTPAPMVDAACRGCHGEKTDELVLASGEILPLGVDLAQLTVSPHSSAAAHPVPCTSCHVNETRYRYPHEENPAQTLAEFRGNVSDSCQECHYPHTPFHEIEQADYTPPTCVDCHGGHDIAGVESMAESVPANCLACHDDQSTEWVAEFLHPLPGFGVGSAEFAGSMRCAGCHEEKFFTWRDTLHARIVQDVAREVDAVVGDFELEDPDRSFTLDDVSYTIGGRLRQLYMTRTVSDTFEILPAQWNVETQEWVPYHLDDGETNDWLQECSGCHVTGLDSETWTFVEFGVGCESCHGTGAAHAADPENVKPYAEVDDQVCGACHSRGTSPDGHPFPTTYRPGDPLEVHFTPANDAEAVWADGSAKRNHQQYMDWRLGSTMSTAPDTSCVTCHAVHDAGAGNGQLKEPTNALCISCHSEQRAIVRHIPFHEKAMSKRDFLCSDCHMPSMATSAVAYDIHNHSLLQPDPQKTMDHGGLDVMPNACNSCHTKPGEDPAWAAETIAFAKLQAPPVTGGFFGPGPTPTSPPPPTPMAAVGQPVVREEVPTGAWIRNTVIAVFWVAVALLVLWIVYRIRMRRGNDA